MDSIRFFGVEPIRKPYYIGVTLEHMWLPLPDLMHSRGRPDIADIEINQTNKQKKTQPILLDMERQTDWNRQQPVIVASVHLLLFDGIDDVGLNNKPVPKMEIIPSEKAQPRLKHYTTRLSRRRSL